MMLLCTHKHAMFHLMLPVKWCHGCKLGITALLGHTGCWIAVDEIEHICLASSDTIEALI